MKDDSNKFLSNKSAIFGFKNKLSKFKIGIILTAVLVIIGATIFISIHYVQTKTEEKEREREKLPENFSKIIYYDLNEIIVNLDTGGKGTSFLKVNITLVVDSQENLAVVKKLTPKIRDTFFMFLRQLRPQDLQSPVSLYQLREALLRRVNKIVYPAEVNDLLFKNILTQ